MIPVQIPDFRRPGEAMVSVPLKLPGDAAIRLQHQAHRLGCSRGALARALVVRGVEQLEASPEVG